MFHQQLNANSISFTFHLHTCKYMYSCRNSSTWAIPSDCPNLRFVLYLIKNRCLEITPRGSDDSKGEVCTITHPAVFAVPLWLHIHFYCVQSLIKQDTEYFYSEIDLQALCVCIKSFIWRNQIYICSSIMKFILTSIQMKLKDNAERGQKMN